MTIKYLQNTNDRNSQLLEIFDRLKSIQPKINDPYFEPILVDFQTCIQTPDLQVDRLNNIKNEMMM